MSISEQNDTTSVCSRNAISDVTFYDSANLVTRIDQTNTIGFPFIFIEKNRIRETEARESFVKHLKEGEKLPDQLFHNDWIILVILAAAFLYSILRKFSLKFIPEVTRFFFFRGIGDPASRDVGALFHWQSTIINLVTFINLALFAYCSALFYDFIPSGISGILFWLISLGIILVIITLRHGICFITGRLSGEDEAFNEYLITVYQFYRFLALILFILVIIISYTSFLPPKTMFYLGFFSMAALYLIRMIRLFLIFIKRNISILYLILYLCALEFLPVLIALKYCTGLF
jgi:hypothetical protein